jgi:tape measure domain-containing protein
MAQNKVSVIIDGKEFVSKEAQQAGRSLTTLGQTSERVSKVIKTGVIASIAAAVAGITSAVKVAKGSLQEAAKMEQIDTSFNVLIGNAEKARQVLSDLRDFSASTPLQFETITKGAQNLMAFGIAAEDVQQKMEMLGNVSQGQADKLESVVRAYGKIRAKGKASLEELNMMTEAGIPILEGLSDNLEVSTDELFKMITAGKVGFGEVDQALQAMTTGTGQFAGMLEKQAGTFSGLVSTYKDNIALAMDEIGQSMLPAAKTITQDLIGGIQRFRDSDAFDDLKDAFENLGGWITDVVKEGGPFNGMVKAFVRFVAWSVNMIPKVGAVFGFVGDVIGITADIIKEKFEEAKAKLIEILDEFGILKAINTTIDLTVQAIGETFQAVKKGMQTGDWSDFWGVGADVLQKGIGIAISLSIAGGAIKGILSSIQGGFGFTPSGKIVSGAALGTLSVYLAVKKAQESGDIRKLAVDMAGAVAAGLLTSFVAGPTTGVYVATLALNFQIGSKAVEAGKKVVQDIKDGVPELSKILSGKMDASKAQTIVGQAGGKAIEIGQAIRDGIKTGMGKAWDFFFKWAEEGEEGTRDGFETHSPSKVFERIGLDLLAGLRSGIKDGSSVGMQLGKDVLEGTKNMLGVHSKSTETEYIGNMMLEGMVAGIEDNSYVGRLTSAWHTLMEKLRSDSTIDVDAAVNDIMGKGGNGEDADDDGGGSEASGGIWKSIKDGLSFFKDGMISAIESLSSFAALADWGGTIIKGVMDVLGPAIDSILQPLIGVLRILGQTIGKILLPIFETLGAVVELLAKGFVWFYNKAIVPVANFFIRAFNGVANTLISIVNGIINLINKIPGIRIGRLSLRQEDQGTLSGIDYKDLMRSGESSTSSYSGGTTGSNTSVQQMTINIHQHYNAPVIGEGGMEQVGGFVVRAIQEYTGIGGTVKIVEAS